MKLPADLNPRASKGYLPKGTPIFYVTVEINGEDHVFEATALDEYTTVNILLKSLEAGYGMEWVEVTLPPPPVEPPIEEEEPPVEEP